MNTENWKICGKYRTTRVRTQGSATPNISDALTLTEILSGLKYVLKKI